MISTGRCPCGTSPPFSRSARNPVSHVIRCRFIFSHVIRCRFIFSGKNDELTPDFRAFHAEATSTLGASQVARFMPTAHPCFDDDQHRGQASWPSWAASTASRNTSSTKGGRVCAGSGCSPGCPGRRARRFMVGAKAAYDSRRCRSSQARPRTVMRNNLSGVWSTSPAFFLPLRN